MAYRSSNQNSANATSVVVTAPAGIADNDILVIALQSGGNEDQVVTWPSGFTELSTSNMANNSSTVACAWKRASGESGNYTVSTTTGDYKAAAMAAYSGRDTVSAPAVVATINNTSSISPRSCDATGVTAVQGDDIVYFLCQNNGGITFTHSPPTNYTERVEATPGSWVSLSLSDRENVSVGATGTLTGTLTQAGESTGFGAFVIRIPATAAAGGVPRFQGFQMMMRNN
jgi:hypothetical protein